MEKKRRNSYLTKDPLEVSLLLTVFGAFTVLDKFTNKFKTSKQQ